MVTLRHFRASDAGALRRLQYAGMPVEAIREMIGQWDTLEFEDRYFEMFAVVRDGDIVGMISLYHRSDSAVSIGPEIFPPCRRKGFGREATLVAMDRARDRGYKVALQQLRSGNAASVALHEGLGFETDRYGYVNRRGEEVFIFFKLL